MDRERGGTRADEQQCSPTHAAPRLPEGAVGGLPSHRPQEAIPASGYPRGTHSLGQGSPLKAVPGEGLSSQHSHSLERCPSQKWVWAAQQGVHSTGHHGKCDMKSRA